jgi:hypothetical protein
MGERAIATRSGSKARPDAAQLAPDIIEAILNWQAAGLSLPRLLEPFPLEWDAQRTALIG